MLSALTGSQPIEVCPSRGLPDTCGNEADVKLGVFGDSLLDAHRGGLCALKKERLHSGTHLVFAICTNILPLAWIFERSRHWEARKDK